MNYKALFAVTAAVLMALAAVAVVSGSTEADSETGISNVSYFEENDKIFMKIEGLEEGLLFNASKTQYAVDGKPASVTGTPSFYNGAYEVTVTEKVDTAKQTISLSLTTNKGITYTYNTYKITVNDTVNGTVTADKTVAKAGEAVNLTVDPATGYELKGDVSVNNGAVTVTETATGYSFSMPAGAVTVSAEFAEITEPTYTVNIGEISNGTVTAEPNKTVKAGTEVTLTAAPAEKYVLDTITVTDKDSKTVKVENNKFIMPASDVTVTAKFVPQVGCKVTFDKEFMTVMNGDEWMKSGDEVPTGTVVTVTLKKLGYTVTPELDKKGQYEVKKAVEFKAVEKEYEDASFSGSILTSTVFGKDQLVTVPKDSVLQSETKITINGKLYVPAGITVKVSAGAELIINGIADIQGNLEVEGADEFADKKTPGKFLVCGNGEATISGTVNVDGVFATYGNGKIVIKSAAEVAGEIFGNIEVSKDATLTVTGLVSEKKAEPITTGSDVNKTVFAVYGNLTVASDIPTIGFDVDLKENGTVVIEKAVLGTAASLIGTADGIITITDGGVVYYDKDDKNALGDATGKNKVIIEGAITVVKGEGADETKYKNFGYGAAVSGITVSTVTEVTKVTEAGEHKDQMKHQAVMSVSGNISVADEIIYDQSENSPVAQTFSADIDATGSSLKIDKDLSLGEKVSASFENVEVAAPVSFVKTLSLKNASINGAVSVPAGATLTLEGEIDVEAVITANAKTTSPAIVVVDGSTITVTGDGSVTTIDKFDVEKFTVNATMYGSYVYVSFDNAIAALNAGTTKEVSAFGEQTLTASAEIPAGTVVKLMKDSKLNIGSKDSTDVVLTVASGTGILLRNNNSNGIEVYGTLDAVKASNIDSSLRGDKIYSDVFSCAFKADGKTQDTNGFAKWTNIYTALDKAESGQTVTIQRDIDGLKSVTVKDGVTLDVNGKTVKVAQKATLTVTGTLDLTDSGSAIVLAEPKMEGENKTAGAAISYTGYVLYLGENVPVTQVGLVLPGAYYTLAEGGDNVLTTYANGAADALKAKDYTVNFKADKDGKIALGEISFVGEKEKVVKIIVAEADLTGTITLSYTDFDIAAGTVDAKFVSGDDTVTVKANVTGLCVENGVLGDAVVLMISGNVANIDDKTDTSVVFDGKAFIAKNFASAADKTVVNGDLTVCGLENALAIFGASALDVAGTVTVQNDSELDLEKLTVAGAVMIEKGKLDAGTATVSGSIDATAKKEGDSATATFGILYIGVDSKILKSATGAAASITGDVTVTNYALVAPDATVPEAFTKENSDYDSTVFIVDGKEYVIAYVYSGAEGKLKIGKIDYKPENAVFENWMDGDKIADTEDVGKIDKVTAKIDYNIYTVKIVVGSGIENVAIDGNLVTGGTMSGLKAGTHTVTYSVGFGYTGTATLTVNGEKQSGMTFTASGTPAAGETIVYNLQLSGIVASSYEPTPVPVPTPAEDDGLSITDYLLIVLVVLIVIMAVIVAMRLMRS